ncbi:MAG: hypothetical protein KF803_02965 [Cyclobacteriaceae bacterium]|nr:hypothetical protein [Cyclobacteriaceae bacterium]
MMRASFAAKNFMHGQLSEDFLERLKRKLIDSLTEEKYHSWLSDTELNVKENGISIFT